MTLKVGQKVVYPNHGVSLVDKIEPGHIDGVEQLYFHLRLLANHASISRVIPYSRPLHSPTGIGS